MEVLKLTAGIYEDRKHNAFSAIKFCGYVYVLGNNLNLQEYELTEEDIYDTMNVVLYNPGEHDLLPEEEFEPHVVHIEREFVCKYTTGKWFNDEPKELLVN